MSSTIIKPGKIHLGVETLCCPKCRFPNTVAIDSDLPLEDWLICANCGYRAILNLTPILGKYGLLTGMSQPEKRDFSHYLQQDLAKI